MTAFKDQVEALFAEVGRPLTGHRAPDGSVVLTLRNGSSIEDALDGAGDRPHTFADAKQMVLAAIRERWPHSSLRRLHWRCEPEMRNGHLYLRLGSTPLDCAEQVETLSEVDDHSAQVLAGLTSVLIDGEQLRRNQWEETVEHILAAFSTNDGHRANLWVSFNELERLGKMRPSAVVPK